MTDLGLGHWHLLRSDVIQDNGHSLSFEEGRQRQEVRGARSEQEVRRAAGWGERERERERGMHGGNLSVRITVACA